MKNSIKILCIIILNLCLVYSTTYAQLNEPTGINIGLSRASTSTIYGLNINKSLATNGSPGTGGYTNIQIIEKDWSGSHAILFNSYASSVQVPGGLSTMGNTKYAHDVGAYTGGAGSIMFFGNGGTLDFYISPLSTGKDSIVSWGTPKMRIERDGNIGIGTSTPDYKLDVLGTIRANEVKVATGWSDFIFEPDYELKSLDQVEEFIEAYGHLPDIPSAEEVEENGISLGDMDAKLLQKIEELTLYMLEMKKENAEIKLANELLNQTVNSQNDRLKLLENEE